jgi:hypothetical protein
LSKLQIQESIRDVSKRECEPIAEADDGSKRCARKEVAPGEGERCSTDQDDEGKPKSDGLCASEAQDEDWRQPSRQRDLGVDGAEGQ